MDKHKIGIIGGGILIALITFYLVTLDKNWVIWKMNEYKLLPQPERFTELYLEDHLKLPKTYTEDGDNSFRFTVHNLEHQPYTYTYVIESIASDSARTINQGTFKLEHDAYKTIKSQIATQEATIRTKIHINLKNKNQSIHFWVN